MDRITDQFTLVQALQDGARYPHAAAGVETLETHISWVLLAGDYAYKIKKALDLGFLDFRTLEARYRYCAEELRLNRRLAPALYLDVVALTGSPQNPAVGGDGVAIEYAVKMRRFPQDRLFDRLLETGRLEGAHFDALAETMAAFHAAAPAAGADDRYGTPQAIERPARDNFTQLRALTARAPAPHTLARLERWSAERARALRPVFIERKRAGRVREGHGDFHLRNIALVDGGATPFDCLEFDPGLRWIDVMNEIAFLLMDLAVRRRADLAWRFLDRYLAFSGDYAGLPVLTFYSVYRAVIRAKIHWLRAQQPGIAAGERRRLERRSAAHLALARALTRAPRPALLITHGVSGSGKTTVSAALVEALGAVRLRSDIERKRLHGLSATTRTGAALGEGAYTAEASARTYEKLAALARGGLAAGFRVLVDAAFLARAQRAAFRRLAEELALPFVILDFSAPDTVLRERVAARLRRGGDASEADLEVLAHQLRTREPLTAAERAHCVTYAPDQDQAEFCRAAEQTVNRAAGASSGNA